MAIVGSSFEKVRHKMVAARIEFMGQLAKFSTEDLTQHVIEVRWSPLQIAHHLYIADGVAIEQIQRVQNEENPFISDGGKIVPKLTEEAETPASLDAVLGGMAARREEIFEFLASLPDEAWERPFRHEEWGDRKFYQLVNVLPAHDQQHTRQLAEIYAKLHEQS